MQNFMNKQLPQLKNELVQEIKDLAKSLQTCETFNGVLSYENKLKSLYEKFVLLKFLDQNKLSPEDLPQPTIASPAEPIEEVAKPSETKKVEEKTLDAQVEASTTEENPATLEANQNITEVEEEEEKPVFFDFEIHKDEAKTVVANFSLDDEEEELEEKGEAMMNERPSAIEEIKRSIVDEPEKTTSTSSIYDIPPMVLDFNDRIGFLNQLFLGDDEFMDSTLDILNRISDPNSTQMYLNDLEQEMHLDEDKREYFERLRELALKRFE
ncbi:hypothetical protein EDM00_00520 [Ornithobacterium rhinotracheale]|nr:hypothetical protein [Ornithobacterium rhinotracheale]